MIQNYLINLDSSRDRFARAVAVLDSAGLAFMRVPAVDGRGRECRAAAGFGRAVSGAEQGCRESHLQALTAFLESPAKLAAVFEDDIAEIDADRLHRCADWLQDRSGWSVAHLSQPVSGFRSLWGSLDDCAIYRAHLFPMTTAGLLWSREGAAAFLAEAPDWPMDHALRAWALRAAGGVGFDRPLVETGGHDSEISDRDVLITAAYKRHRAALRRRQKAIAAWHRLRWRCRAR